MRKYPMIRFWTCSAFAILLATPVAAAPDWRGARSYEVLLSSYGIQPRTLRMKGGEPVRLRLVNQSEQKHTFSARIFFASAEARRRDREELKDGAVAVPAGRTREIVLVPARGRYHVRSPNLFYRVMGMTGEIIVE